MIEILALVDGLELSPSARKARRSSAVVGLGRLKSGPSTQRLIGAQPISECTSRLYSSSTQAWVASLSCASVSSSTP